MRRATRWLGIGLAVVLAGCGESASRDDPRLEDLALQQGRTQEAARQMAPIFTADANEYERGGKLRVSLENRLEVEERAFEQLEEAEQTFDTARRYVELGDKVGVEGAAKTRLDATIASMTRATTAAVERALRAVGEARGAEFLTEDRRDALMRDMDRDRTALKAYRYDLAITMRLGPPQMAPVPATGTAR